MQVNNGISAVINTYNASRHLQRVLDSLKGFDEIVVCDMESTDRTVDIARKNGCKVVTFPKGNHKICEPARDFAIHSASCRWVLVVDADELVTPELRDYLYERIATGDCPQGLAVPRRNLLLGQYVHSSPDYQLRFLEKERATWPPVIHRRPEVDGKVESVPMSLNNVTLLHLDDSGIASRIDKMNRYSDYEVSKRRGRRYGVMSMLWRPMWFFLRSYLFQGGWRDGRRGVVNAYLSTMYQMMLISKVTEDELRK